MNHHSVLSYRRPDRDLSTLCNGSPSIWMAVWSCSLLFEGDLPLLSGLWMNALEQHSLNKFVVLVNFLKLDYFWLFPDFPDEYQHWLKTSYTCGIHNQCLWLQLWKRSFNQTAFISNENCRLDNVDKHLFFYLVMLADKCFVPFVKIVKCICADRKIG